MQELTSLPAVAKNIHISCKKCETDRYHRVLAHLDAESAKVECEVCGSKKTFRLKKAKSQGSKVSGSGVKKKKTSRKSQKPEVIWQELKDKVDLEATQPYNMRTCYSVDTPIDHPKFGLGIVTDSNGAAIEVTFEDGSKSLVHNRS